MEFSKGFFQKEIRCDFEIPEMMKRAWAAELEVLQVVAEVCEKNGLQYFADWGTLLGAVRHKGFIPWDDDIDICLKREDYMKLIRILPEELPKGFVMTGIYADSARLIEAALCQNIRVMADEEEWGFNEYMKRFHGFPYQRIGIDIFPLDYMPSDNEALELIKGIVEYGVSILRDWYILQSNNELEKRLQNMEKLCSVTLPRNGSTPYILIKVIDSVSAIYRADEADELTEYRFYVNRPGYRMKKEWYKEAVKLPFEETEIAVPCSYHEVLTAQFGDYMTPVKDDRGHNYPFYGCMEDELVKQIRATGFTGTVDEFCRKVSCGELQV